MKKLALTIGVIVVTVLLSASACLGQDLSKLNQAWNGVPATMTTFTQQGALVDRVHGVSFRVTRDERFDTSSTSSDGKAISNPDSEVLLISLGDSHISHVGSTMIMAQDGIVEVAGATQTISFENAQAGVPWLNDLLEKNRNLWQGKSKTIMMRSQDGTPIAVYAGNAVEQFATDVPKSTWFRVDGKMLLVYRADYTVYDNSLLGR